MHVLVTTEHRFDQTRDGRVWTDGQCSHQFWQRYLDVFDAVTVLARTRSVREVSSRAREASGPGVRFASVPYYVGPWEYLRTRQSVRAVVAHAAGEAEAVVMRLGSQLAACLEPELRRHCRPYGVEVVSDPYQAFAPGVVHHPLRPCFRQYFTRMQKRLVKHAAAAAYVTHHHLQGRYPSHASFVTSFASVDLSDQDYVQARAPKHRTGPFHITTVASLSQPYKGIHILIDALGAVVKRGFDVTASVIGDGRYRPRLETGVTRLGLESRVTFLGSLPAGRSIQHELDRSDLFVLPSLTEGLPRAMIEAMARGLPCVGTAVGGIPELLHQDDLVLPNDVRALTERLCTLMESPNRLQEMSRRNLQKSREYHQARLQPKRVEFYEFLREVTRRAADAWRRRKEHEQFLPAAH